MAATEAYPLAWPPGWRRTTGRQSANFGKRSRDAGRSYPTLKRLTIADARQRVLDELGRMGVGHPVVISSNLKLRLDGLPLSNQAEPADPGIAVYWQDHGRPRVIAIDLYDRCADNLAAVAATLDAMRAIARHGGAVVGERAFEGFAALPAPGADAKKPWFEVLGVPRDANPDTVRDAYRKLASIHHPDRPGGDADRMAEINQALDTFRAP